MNLKKLYDEWRKRTFPASKEDVTWRHEFICTRLEQIDEKLFELKNLIDTRAQGKNLFHGNANNETTTLEATLDEIIALIDRNSPRIDPKSLEVIEEMYHPDVQIRTDEGEVVEIDKKVRVSIEHGMLLHDLMRKNSVARSLEIGFAYGFSTVWMLDALRDQAAAKHVAIDPFETTMWKSVGLNRVNKLGFEGDFEWVNDLSIHVLSDLIRKKEVFDFIYIDGDHRFDSVIVDFYLSDQLLRQGGLIVLDDMWMPSIRTVVDFLIKNRNYEHVQTAVSNVAVFRKLQDDDREWHHFNPFDVATT